MSNKECWKIDNKNGPTIKASWHVHEKFAVINALYKRTWIQVSHTDTPTQNAHTHMNEPKSNMLYFINVILSYK